MGPRRGAAPLSQRGASVFSKRSQSALLRRGADPSLCACPSLVHDVHHLHHASAGEGSHVGIWLG